MKKLLIVLSAFILLFIATLAVIPVLFKDDIVKAVQRHLNENINAEVQFSDLGLSLFSNFPHLTVKLNDLKVTGEDQFAGVVLAEMDQFRLVLDIMSVIQGTEYEINELTLEKPKLDVRVKKDGSANWDITKSNADEAPTDSSVTAFNIQLEKYSIRNADIKYNDQSSNTKVLINGLNHTGKGNFSEKLVGLDTKTKANSFTMEMDNTTYLNQAVLDFDLEMLWDQSNNLITLKENTFGINELNLGLDGWVKLNENSTGMDLKFNAQKTDFSNILSMVPGIYKKDFEDIDTKGQFSLKGVAKGNLSATAYPAFNVDINVTDGYFNYPDLPSAASNIQLDLKMESKDGNLDNLKVTSQKFHMELGKNPIDGHLIASGLFSDNIQVGGAVKAMINLAELSTVFPMEGQQMKGQFLLDATADGIYNEKRQLYPKVNATMKLTDGYLKSQDFPSALEKMTMEAVMTNTTGKINDTYLKVDQFHSEIDGEPIDVTMEVRNFDDPNYILDLNGTLDLTKLNKIYPMEGTSMSGKVLANINTQGKMSDVEAERYSKLPTKGAISLSNISYASADLPQGLKVKSGRMSFSPDRLNVDQFEGVLGKSSVNLKGYLQNYLGYLLAENETLKGRIELSSPLFDANEWMTESDEAESAKSAEQPMEVFEVPQNIDFLFQATITKVLYDNLELKDFKGGITMRNQKVSFNGVSFKTLGGNLSLNGSYSSRDISKPVYDLNVGMRNLKIAEVVGAFESVKMLAPVAKYMTGDFDSDINLSGKLKGDMTPDLGTLTSLGHMFVLNSSLTNFPVLSSIIDKTKLKNLDPLNINNVKVFFEVENGRIHVEPFDVKTGNTSMNISGYGGMDGSLDYTLKLDIPSGKAGAAATNALGGLTGLKLNSTDRIKVDLKLGGTMDNPKITGLGGGSITESLKNEAEKQVKEVVSEAKEEALDKANEAKEKIQNELDAKRKEAEEKAKAEADRLKKEAEDRAKAEADRLKKEAQQAAEKAKKDAENKAKDALKNLFKKK